jgi:hypothetical protein
LRWYLLLRKLCNFNCSTAKTYPNWTWEKDYNKGLQNSAGFVPACFIR